MIVKVRHFIQTWKNSFIHFSYFQIVFRTRNAWKWKAIFFYVPENQTGGKYGWVRQCSQQLWARKLGNLNTRYIHSFFFTESAQVKIVLKKMTCIIYKSVRGYMNRSFLYKLNSAPCTLVKAKTTRDIGKKPHHFIISQSDGTWNILKVPCNVRLK